MKKNIEIKVKSICYGWEDIKFTINGKRYRYNASCCWGGEPLSNLILAVEELIWKEKEECTMTWNSEPGELIITITRDPIERDLLHIDANEKGEFFDPKVGPWTQDDKYNFKVSLNELKDAVIDEALRMLREYGLRGFDSSWASGENTFPLKSLLILMGSSVTFDEETESYRSNIIDELELLMKIL